MQVYTVQYRTLKQEVVSSTTPPSLVTPEFVVMTTYGATSDDKVVKPTIPCPQCMWNQVYKEMGSETYM